MISLQGLPDGYVTPDSGFCIDDVRIFGKRRIRDDNYDSGLPPDVIEVDDAFSTPEDQFCNTDCSNVISTCSNIDNTLAIFFGDTTSCDTSPCGDFCVNENWTPVGNVQNESVLNFRCDYIIEGSQGPPADQISEWYICPDQFFSASCALITTSDPSAPMTSRCDRLQYNANSLLDANPQVFDCSFATPTNVPLNDAWILFRWINLFSNPGSYTVLDNFSLIASDCNPDAPTLLSPANGTTDLSGDSVECSWSNVFDTTPCSNGFYRFEFQEFGNPATRITIDNLTQTTTTLTNLPPETTIEWYVFFVTPDGEEPSNVFIFTTASKRPGAALAISGGPGHCDTAVDIHLDKIVFDGGAKSTNQVLFGGAKTEIFRIERGAVFNTAIKIGDIGIPGYDGVTGMAILPDGRLVATANADAVFNDDERYGVLIEIDPLTGAAADIGEISNSTLVGGVGRFPGLTCYEPTNKLLTVSTGSSRALWEIDPVTGVGTFLGNLLIGGGGNGFTYHPGDGLLYRFSSSNSGVIWIVDPATGSPSGPLFSNLPWLSAMAVEPRTLRMFGTENRDPIGSSLVELFLGTETWTVLGPILRNGITDDINMDAIIFGPDPDDPICYDVFFGPDPAQLQLIATNLKEPCVSRAGLNPLQPCTRYYWQVRSYQNNYGETFSAVFKFTTRIVEDLNLDSIVNFFDFSKWAAIGLNQPCGPPDWCNGADINRDNTADLNDALLIFVNWLNLCNLP